MLFSVIIPTRDRAEDVANAIDLVLAQSLHDFELIVVDDGSTDETLEVVARFGDERLSVIRQPPLGVSAARNHGADACSGKYLVFLDSDDRPDADWLAAFASETATAETALITCPVLWDDPGGTQELIPNGDMGPELDHQRGLHLAGAFAVAREVFEAVGRYDTQMTYAENQELFLRVVPFCLERGLRIAVGDEPHLTVRGRRSERRYDIEKYFSMNRLLRLHYERLNLNRRMLSDLLSVKGVAAARLGMYSAARRAFSGAMRARPFRVLNLARFTLALFPPLARAYWGVTPQEEELADADSALESSDAD